MRGWFIPLALFFTAHCAARVEALAIAPKEGFTVVCFDIRSGRSLWAATPRKLGKPTLFVSNGKLIAEWKGLGRSRSFGETPIHLRYALDVATGTVKEAASVDLDKLLPVDVAPLAQLGDLVDGAGRTFAFEAWTTRSLAVVEATGTTVIKRLEGNLTSLSIDGDLAIFSFGGGEVYAYDFEAGQLKWEFDAAKHIKRPFEAVSTSVVAAGDITYVAANQFLFALESKSARIRWRTKLSVKGKRPDAHARRLGKIGKRLVATSGDSVFVIDARTGKLSWSYFTGHFGEPWPLVLNGRLFVVVHPRGGGSDVIEPASYVAPPPPPTALRIVRRGANFSINPILRHKIPQGATVWWSLKPPPATGGADTVTLRISNDDGDNVELDVSKILAGRISSAYIKFSSDNSGATLARGGRELASAEW